MLFEGYIPMSPCPNNFLTTSFLHQIFHNVHYPNCPSFCLMNMCHVSYTLPHQASRDDGCLHTPLPFVFHTTNPRSAHISKTKCIRFTDGKPQCITAIVHWQKLSFQTIKATNLSHGFLCLSTALRFLVRTTRLVENHSWTLNYGYTPCGVTFFFLLHPTHDGNLKEACMKYAH